MDSSRDIKTGKRPYLPREEYVWTYLEAQKQARLFFKPFNEYERLADNDVRDDLPENMPKVNDGSLSDLLEKTVERVVGQMFSGNVNIIESIDPQTGQPTNPQPWLDELVNFEWSKRIVPNARTQAPFFRKIQIAAKRALTYGSCPLYSFYTSNGSYRGADFMIPYIRDVYLEVGKSSDQDSDYIFMDSYYTKLQIARLIAQGNKLAEIGVDSPWDIEMLKKVYDTGLQEQKEYLSKNKAERNRPVMATRFRFTTAFQRGIQAPFDTFWTGSGNVGGASIVRSKINEDPTGDIPIHFLYAYDDLVNPYGVGQIKKSGGTQNVLDYLTQLHVLATQLGLQPPILVEGETTDTDIKSMIYAPNQFWFTGGAKVDLMETGSTTYREFPQAYGIYKGNLVNAQGQAPIDVSGESGNPTNSKVPASVKARAQQMSEFDNHHRNQIFNAFNRLAKSMINIHFANMQGEDLVRLEMDDAVKLTRAGLIPPDPENPNLPSTQQIVIDWDNLRGKFDFEIDTDSIIYKDNQEIIDQLSAVLQMIEQNPYMLEYITSSGYNLNVGEIYATILTKLGVPTMEKILEPMTPQDKAQAASIPPMVFDKPHIDLRYPDMPPAAQLALLQKVGLPVTMMDVLMGPVADINIRGVYQPEPAPDPRNPLPAQPAGPPSDVQLPNNASLEPNPASQPPPVLPGVTPGNAAPGASAVPPGGPDPRSIALMQQTMKEHGVNQRGAQAIMHAKARGIPDEDILAYLKKNSIGKYGGMQPTGPAGPPVPAPEPAPAAPKGKKKGNK